MSQCDYGETRKHFLTTSQLFAAVKWYVRQKWAF